MQGTDTSFSLIIDRRRQGFDELNGFRVSISPPLFFGGEEMAGKPEGGESQIKAFASFTVVQSKPDRLLLYGQRRS